MDKKGANHAADQNEQLDGPHAVLQARSRIAACLHTNEDEAEQRVEQRDGEKYAVDAELAPFLLCEGG